MSSTEEAENKGVVKQLTESFNTLDRETFDPCYADEIVVHTKDEAMRPDHDTHWSHVLDIFESFPNLHATIDSMMAENDRVFVRWTYAGTHDGTTDDTESTGVDVEWRHWSEYRFEEGAIVRAWQLSDSLYLNLELGLVAET